MWRSAIAMAVLSGTACTKSSAHDTPVVESAAPQEVAPAGHAFTKQLRQDFGKKYSCPENRVDVKERTDLDPLKALAANDEDFSLGTPSGEVASDPERVEKWRADREAEVASKKSKYTRNTMFEVSGCGHDDILGCHEHHGPNGVSYPNWPDCTPANPPPAPLAQAKASLAPGKWTRIDAPGMVGSLQSFDVDANLDWASALGAVWSADAVLFRVDVAPATLDGTIDVSSGGASHVVYYFNSPSQGTLDLGVEIDPGGLVTVSADRHKDTKPRKTIGKPACPLSKAFAAVRDSASLEPKTRADAIIWTSDDGKPGWHVQYKAQGKLQKVKVDATTCAIVK